MIEFIGVWSFLGYVAAILFPVPDIKKFAWIYLFFLGPLAWVLFIIVSIDMKLRDKRNVLRGNHAVRPYVREGSETQRKKKDI